MFFIPNSHMKAAACTDLSERDKRRFFDGTDNERMKKICFGCPVRESCLEQALEMEHRPGSVRRWGIWGGMTARERYDVYGPLPDSQEYDADSRWEVHAYSHVPKAEVQEAEMSECAWDGQAGPMPEALLSVA